MLIQKDLRLRERDAHELLGFMREEEVVRDVLELKVVADA
jgi:hypothetical protein